jgi:hypothetical protein
LASTPTLLFLLSPKLWPDARLFLRSALVYFDLVDEIDNDQLVYAMQSVISFFPAESIPYAVSVVQRLATNFQRLVTMPPDPDDDQPILTAIQLFTAVSVRMASSLFSSTLSFPVRLEWKWLGLPWE